VLKTLSDIITHGGKMLSRDSFPNRFSVTATNLLCLNSEPRTLLFNGVYNACNINDLLIVYNRLILPQLSLETQNFGPFRDLMTRLVLATNLPFSHYTAEHINRELTPCQNQEPEKDPSRVLLNYMLICEYLHNKDHTIIASQRLHTPLHIIKIKCSLVNKKPLGTSELDETSEKPLVTSESDKTSKKPLGTSESDKTSVILAQLLRKLSLSKQFLPSSYSEDLVKLAAELEDENYISNMATWNATWNAFTAYAELIETGLNYSETVSETLKEA